MRYSTFVTAVEETAPDHAGAVFTLLTAWP
jgi:hypothetical protein